MFDSALVYNKVRMLTKCCSVYFYFVSHLSLSVSFFWGKSRGYPVVWRLHFWITHFQSIDTKTIETENTHNHINSYCTSDYRLATYHMFKGKFKYFSAEEKQNYSFRKFTFTFKDNIWANGFLFELDLSLLLLLLLMNWSDKIEDERVPKFSHPPKIA